MSKSLLAIVWIAGPLTGVLVQPYVGIMSDNCRSKFGKRVPFMVTGAVATAISFLALAWAKEIIHPLLGLFGANPDSRGVEVSTMIWATLFVYVLDFSINAVQAGIRAFIVDNAPTHQQEDANAWAGRITGIGNILGYLSGYVNLPQIFPWLGHNEFQVLSAIAAFSICTTVLISCLYIRERDPRVEGAPKEGNPGLISFFRQVFNSIRRLSPQIRKVCEAQFFNWMGWFGFLFYMTTYIAQFEVNPIFAANPDLSPDEIDQAWEDATRTGTFAFLLFAIVSFTSSMLLPFFIIPSYHAPFPTTKPAKPSSPLALSHSTPSLFASATSAPPPTLHSRLTRLLNFVQIPWLTLRRAWLLSHFMFALCMAITFFISSTTAATVLTAFIGIPWALCLWAPFALISAEISKRDTEARMRIRPHSEAADASGMAGRQEDQAGVVLGLHNVAVSAPQILATLVSSAIFKLAQKPRGKPYDHSVGWVLRFGGLAALVAAFFTWRIGEEGGKGKAGGGRRGDGRENGSAEEGQMLQGGEVV
ncbi:hypothetical protein MMC21_003372 [Puttea exsequens]|nr:hypothetical protein [Puttea exsequens]